MDRASSASRRGAAEIAATIRRLGDIGQALNQADPAGLKKLYYALRLEMIDRVETRVVEVTIRPERTA